LGLKKELKLSAAAYRDFIRITVISVVVLAIAVFFDLFDRFVFWYVKQTEPAEIEEIIVVVWVMSFAFAVFSWRRWRELVTEIRKRKQVEDELRAEKDRLQDALSKIKTLSGMLPICASCKKIRDDKGYWNQIETYIRSNTDATFSHAICPECAKRLYPEYYREEDANEDI